MKIVFCGPTLPLLGTPEGRDRFGGLHVLPPAREGDVLRAVHAGATAIGIVDGRFGEVPAVWHKEILHALDAGVFVCGAASMGALRAAECAPFGMVPVGRIAEDYLSGRRVDDADVAQLHGPEELGYPALSEPLVNVEAVLARAVHERLMDEAEGEALARLARGIFFRNRTWPAILQARGVPGDHPLARAIRTLARTVNPKRDDALLLAELMNGPELPGRPVVQDWELQRSRQLCARISKLCY